jgi:hypothetical protein
MRAGGLASLSVLSVLSVVGCILAVSPETYGDRCRFAGEGTQCGSCVRTACQAEVNAECDGDALRAVESCAARHDASCGTIPDGPLAACVKTRCAGVCTVLAGTSETHCEEPPLGAGSACTCTQGGVANDAVCDSAAYPQTICCAPKGWPAPGLACSCRPVSCNATTDGCFCSLVTNTPVQSACSGFACCAERDACTCRAKGCYPFETQVPTCDVTVLGCADGQVRVASCSVRTP